MAKPTLVCLDDYEDYARKHMDKAALSYFTTGADNEITLKENREAYTRLKLRPRVLRDVSKRDLSTTILGSPLKFPICIAPCGAQGVACQEGEVATVKAADSMGTCMTLSTNSNCTLEEVSQAAPNTLKWFQLYVWKRRHATEELVRRVENAGFKALVFTVDVPLIGKRRSNLYLGGFRLPPPLKLANLRPEEQYKDGERREYGGATAMKDDTLTWECVKWLKSITKLPIILKGILTAEDALLALQYKVDAIIVSNHGGRQLDTVQATIDALPEIISAVNGEIEVYVDGGIRTGTDVFKAIALGAKAVFIGRPIIYGLVYAGEEGARQVLQLLKDELSQTMALTGCTKISDIKSSHVRPRIMYPRL
ncbi:2-Hydroxyacid oxidase 2-like [Glandiceps talaboti]